MRRGWKTTEFWVSIVIMVTVTASAMLWDLTPETAVVVDGLVSATYAISRGLAKIGHPGLSEEQSST